MKLSNYITASFGLSLLVHIILLLSLAEVKIASPLPLSEDRAKKPKRLTIWTRMRPEMPRNRENTSATTSRQPSLAERTQAESERALQEIFEKEHLSRPAPPATARFSGIEKAKILPKLPTPPDVKKATAPRPEIVEIDASKLSSERIGRRTVVPKAKRENVPVMDLPSLLPEGPLTDSAGPTYDVGIRFSTPKFAAPAIISGDGQLGVSGAGIAPDSSTMLDGAGMSGGNPDNASLKPFDHFVNTTMFVKDSPDGGYFMLQISANEKSESVREINKDVMFIIDRSSSISYKKFRAFKEAAITSLAYLNPQDRFNIVTFTDEPFIFATGYVPANGINKDKGRKFIDRLVKGGMTNLFDGLYPFVKNTDPGDGRPLNIFLLTDGIATVNIYKDDDFIRMVTDINPGHVSIFPFCAGDTNNRELLDFLAFLNRGKCIQTADVNDISNTLTGFITEHCNLLIQDLEYIAEGSIAQTVYPRKLQHLYRGGNVTLYGKYSREDKEIVITLIGRDHENNKRDIILRFNLPNCRRTDAPIDRQWAATKILHLLADRTLTTDIEKKIECTNEIKKLAMEFNLSVPY